MRTTVPIERVKSVALFPSDRERAGEATVVAARWLTERGIRAVIPQECIDAGLERPPGCEVVDGEPECDLTVALGGDGTLLRAARWAADAGIPVLGVNLGTLGFLSAFGAPGLADGLQAAVEGRLVWESRLRVKVEVVRDGSVVQSEIACNDCYVKHGNSPRMLQLVTEVGGFKMAEYRADGLIISTPMGSTAYNLAAGGPIVDAGTQTLVITPICPHSLTHRPVVIAASSVVSVTFAGPDADRAATLSVDGQWGVPLQVGDEISVTQAKMPLKLVPPSSTVFEVLRHKLGWSGANPDAAS